MFKKWKDRLSEVGEEVKRDPRFQSVNRIAQDLSTSLNKSASKESLSSANNMMSDTGVNNDHFFSLGDDDESVLTPPPQEEAAAAAAAAVKGFHSVELSHPSAPLPATSGSPNAPSEAETTPPRYVLAS